MIFSKSTKKICCAQWPFYAFEIEDFNTSFTYFLRSLCFFLCLIFDFTRLKSSIRDTKSSLYSMLFVYLIEDFNTSCAYFFFQIFDLLVKIFLVLLRDTKRRLCRNKRYENVSLLSSTNTNKAYSMRSLCCIP